MAITASLITFAMFLPQPAQEDRVAVKDLDFMSGHWRGETDGMVVEEVWLPPHLGTMACVFRMSVGDKVTLLELGSIEDTENGAAFYLRHFDTKLVPWASEADGPLTADVVLVDEDGVRFEITKENAGVEAITYDVEGDTLTANVIFGGGREPFTLVYERVESD